MALRQRLAPAIICRVRAARSGRGFASSAAPERQEESHIILDRRSVEGCTGKVASLTLNLPKRFNVLTSSMIEELHSHVEAIGRDESVRVIVLKAAGDNFCGGHDIRQMSEHSQHSDTPYFERFFARCSRFMIGLQKVPQPVIARVQGVASGAGCQLVAACDLAIASEDARFATAGVNFGLFCSTPSVALSRNVSRKRAFEMLVTGDFISAQTAMDWGLVNRVVPGSELDSAVDDLARTIASKPAVAVTMGKRLFYQQLEKSQLAEAYYVADLTMSKNIVEPDAKEGMEAFVQKRKPSWAP